MRGNTTAVGGPKPHSVSTNKSKTQEIINAETTNEPNSSDDSKTTTKSDALSEGASQSQETSNAETTNESNIEDQKHIDYAETSKIIDKWAFNIVFAFIVIFNCFYWSFVILM